MVYSTVRIGGSMIMKIRPLHDWVLVSPAEKEVKSAGGILIPESAKEKPTKGEVLAVGRGRMEEERDSKGDLTGDKKFIETEVKAGEVVMFRRFGVDEITLEGEDYFMIRESDILGIL
jgi:chaperonin GroES